MSGRKSPQKRPIRRHMGKVRFAKTGWWCAQSDTNPSPVEKGALRELTGQISRISAHLAAMSGLNPIFAGLSSENSRVTSTGIFPRIAGKSLRVREDKSLHLRRRL